ncbi:glycosyltransferase [Paenisporosarcina macmurdoensis]|uniref:Glycosyltransferase n=1 Tax=Paenisporosarcina macmurdoensis TaxID=212659 RepID=A0ABW1LE40_9BACL
MTNIWNWMFGFLSILVVFYMTFTALSYIILFLLSFRKVSREGKLDKKEMLEDLANSETTIPVSIIVPAYNEEIGIISTVRSLLTLQYPQFEIIVVDDGSKDQTLAKLIEAYGLEVIDYAIRKHVETMPIHVVYKSTIFPNLVVVSKENGGKADALNSGINLSNFPYFCAIDGDSILEQDALLKAMKPVLAADGNIIAVGGSIRIANGTTISRSKVEVIELPNKPLVIMQIVEYFRAFLIGRLGFSRFNQLLIVSGAFGVFRKDKVIHVGGYHEGTVGEDMELIVRLHRMIREEKLSDRIEYIPDPVCWTEAPESLNVLRLQRIRWQRGLAETIYNHRKMLFNPKYGSVGLLTLPYFFFVELLGAVFEFTGFLLIVGGLLFDFLDPTVVFIIFLVTVIYGSFISSLAVLLEEMTMHKYPKVSHLMKLFFWSLTESFWYRPILVIWRLEGLIAFFTKKSEWGQMQRKGISS